MFMFPGGRMNHPLVSVVTAGYNASKNLLDAIYSVLNQTYTNIEYIYVDDCSTDSSCTIINKYIDDPRFTLLENTENMGQSASLNRGILTAVGKYIAILDADDISMPFRVQRQVELLEKNINASFCATGYYLINEKGIVEDRCDLNYNKLECFFRMHFNNVLMHSTLMFRESAINKLHCYATIYGIAENYELLLHLLGINSFVIESSSCIKYRISPKGITRTKKGKMNSIVFEILDKHYKNNYDISLTKEEYSAIFRIQSSIKEVLLACKFRKKVFFKIKSITKIYGMDYVRFFIVLHSLCFEIAFRFLRNIQYPRIKAAVKAVL